MFFPLFILIIWFSHIKIMVGFLINTLNFGEVLSQFWPSNLIFRVPLRVIRMCRCKEADPLSQLDVYICPINIIICVMLVTTQWYSGSAIFFFLENETKNPKRRLEPASNFSI